MRSRGAAIDPAREREREIRRREYAIEIYNELWRTLPQAKKQEPEKPEENKAEQQALQLPEENLLYFLEKNAPKLDGWKRELLRIVRVLSQYFYPQRQTKVMNEGCATFVHYEIMNRMYERGLLTEGSMLEFMHMHSAVVYQPAFSDRGFSGLNPYALGLRHDARHQAHLHGADQGGSRPGSPISPATRTTWACCARRGPTSATRASSCST